MGDTPQSMGGLAPEHALFEPFVGRFRAEVRLFMGEGEPAVMAGMMENALELGGRYLRQTFEGDGGDGPAGAFAGRGYWGYNTVAKRFEGFWIDTASTCFQIEHGSVDGSGRRWEMIGEMTDPHTGGLLRKRTVIELIDADHHTMVSHFMRDEGPEFRAMEIVYRRVGEAPRG